jgi:hypothetical protein
MRALKIFYHCGSVTLLGLLITLNFQLSSAHAQDTGTNLVDGSYVWLGTNTFTGAVLLPLTGVPVDGNAAGRVLLAITNDTALSTFNLCSYTENYSTYFDDVVTLGWNLSPHVTLVNPDRPGFGFSFERQFQGPGCITPDDFELHLHVVYTNGTPTGAGYRPWTWNMGRNEPTIKHTLVADYLKLGGSITQGNYYVYLHPSGGEVTLPMTFRSRVTMPGAQFNSTNVVLAGNLVLGGDYNARWAGTLSAPGGISSGYGATITNNLNLYNGQLSIVNSAGDATLNLRDSSGGGSALCSRNGSLLINNTNVVIGGNLVLGGNRNGFWPGTLSAPGGISSGYGATITNNLNLYNGQLSIVNSAGDAILSLQDSTGGGSAFCSHNGSLSINNTSVVLGGNLVLGGNRNGFWPGSLSAPGGISSGYGATITNNVSLWSGNLFLTSPNSSPTIGFMDSSGYNSSLCMRTGGLVLSSGGNGGLSLQANYGSAGLGVIRLYTGGDSVNPAATLDASKNFRVAGTISGNGTGLTNLNGANIAPGTINIKQLDAGTAAQLAQAGSRSIVTNLSAANLTSGTNSADVGFSTVAAGGVVVAGNIFATGTITPNSDRNQKTDFAPVDPAEVLAKVAALPIQQWRFKAEDPAVKHVGPMAQDFRAAFGLGEKPTAIATVDADGVAFAAIQALNQELEQVKAEAQRREAENAELKARLDKLEQLLDSK